MGNLKNTNECTCKTETETQTEGKLAVTQEEGGEP